MTTLPRSFRKVGGVVGGAASGKDTVARIFAANGYEHISASDLVRAEIAARGLAASRRLQTEIANELRSSKGDAYWVEAALGRASNTAKDVIVSGIYAPSEGLSIVKQHGGFIVAVLAGEGDDSQTRYARLRERASGSRDELSLSEFIDAHKRENSGKDPSEANISSLQAMAQFTVYNTGDLTYLEKQTLGIIESLERTYYD